MLQLIGQTQNHRDHLRWLRHCGEGAQKFFARCLAGVSFRHRLRMGKFFNRMVAPLKLRERQLQQSEALHRRLIQEALDGIFVVNRELRFIEVNEKFCVMAGCRREELLQSTLSEVLARAIVAEKHVHDLLGRRPLRAELIIQPSGESSAASSRPCCMPVSIVPALTRLAPSGLDGEFTSAKANGRSALPSEPLCHSQQNGCAHPNTNGTLSRRQSFPRTIDLNAAPINDELYMGIARDVTEKKHYEAELHRAAELRELLLRTMNDGIAVLDREGYLLIGNRAIEEILEMSQAELTQHRFTAFKNGWQFRTLDGKKPAGGKQSHSSCSQPAATPQRCSVENQPAGKRNICR
jgi:PAS domain-containing protein